MEIKYKKWLNKNTSSLVGKTVAVTGSTGGLGKALCRYLAYLGADLVFVDRNAEKVRALRCELEDAFSVKTRHVSCDMSDVCSVVRAANELLSLERIDCFIHNAGAYAIPRNTGALGYDNVFTINFTSAYYLIKRLRDKVLGSGGRFVVVGSIAHGYSKIKPDSVDFKECKRASLVYGNAKRHLMFSLYKLFQNEGSLAVVHPGISFTNITAHYPPLLFAIIKYPMKVIFSRPEKACLSILRGVFETTDYNEWIGPSLFDVWGMPKKKRLKSAKEEEIKIIYERAEKIYAEAGEFEKSLGYETKA